MRITIATAAILLLIAGVIGHSGSQFAPAPASVPAAVQVEKLAAISTAEISTASPEVPPAPKQPQDLAGTARQLESEIANLRFEVEQGRYVERINDPATPDYIREDLKNRLRLMVDKTIAFSHVTLKLIDQGQSI